MGDALERAMTLTVTIPGRPVGRRSGRKAEYTQRSERAYMQRVRDYVHAGLREHYADIDWHELREHRGKVWMSVKAYYPDKRRHDADNIAKACGGALQRVCYRNDKQVGWRMIYPFGVDKVHPRLELTIEWEGE